MFKAARSLGMTAFQTCRLMISGALTMTLVSHDISVIDLHTGGEPSRLVLAGFSDLGRGSMAQRHELLQLHHDHWRTATVLESRGSDVIVGALTCPPLYPDKATGVIRGLGQPVPCMIGSRFATSYRLQDRDIIPAHTGAPT